MTILDDEFNKAIFFEAVPRPFSSIYHGTADDIARYGLELPAGRGWLLVAEVMTGEEKELWDSFKQMLAFALKTAEASLFGSFEFSLVTAGSPEKLPLFQPAGLAQLLVNHGRLLKDGERRLVPYASSWALFRKLAPGDWGKIAFKENLILVKDRSRLDLLVKRMIQAAAELEGPVWLALHDLGRSPVFRFGEEDQTVRLEKFLVKNKGMLGTKIPAITIYHGKQRTDLAAQFGVDGDRSLDLSPHV
ncbi:MAG TPA: hypothetical protein VL688_07775 [Verrucomicrobiae bacterium]|jgi:hypothetical protein|nr:hypothetical protein [Verrucomicrobiae bacterium]